MYRWTRHEYNTVAVSHVRNSAINRMAAISYDRTRNAEQKQLVHEFSFERVYPEVTGFWPSSPLCLYTNFPIVRTFIVGCSAIIKLKLNTLESPFCFNFEVISGPMSLKRLRIGFIYLFLSGWRRLGKEIKDEQRSVKLANCNWELHTLRSWNSTSSQLKKKKKGNWGQLSLAGGTYASASRQLNGHRYTLQTKVPAEKPPKLSPERKPATLREIDEDVSHRASL